MTNNNRSQNRYIVNFKFQLKYTLMVVVVSTIVFVILGYKFYQSEIGKQKLLQITNPEVLNLVQAQDHTTLYYLIGFLFLEIASILFLGFMLTHRIAGPIFRVQRTLEKSIEENKILPIAPVRKNDEFQGFFDTLDRFIATFLK